MPISSKSKSILLFAIIAIGVILLISNHDLNSMVFSQSYSAAPGKWTVDMTGRISPFVVPLLIGNTDSTTASASILVMSPNYVYEGNAILPNLTWVSLETKKVSISPSGQAKVNVTISIPDVAANYNKSWEVWVQVSVSSVVYRCRWTIHTPKDAPVEHHEPAPPPETEVPPIPPVPKTTPGFETLFLFISIGLVVVFCRKTYNREKRY
jgi:hypothetical protein